MIFKKKFTEEEMIKGCIDNDRSAQEFLYKSYFDIIWNMCMKHMKNEADAMDVVNDGFFKVFTKLDKYESKGNFEGWIRRVVYNTMVDHIRKNQKYTRFLMIDDYDVGERELSSANLHEEDLMKEIDKLPHLTKEVFLLYAVEGYNHKEIAEQLEMSEGTSRWYLSEARKKLRELINNLDNRLEVG